MLNFERETLAIGSACNEIQPQVLQPALLCLTDRVFHFSSCCNGLLGLPDVLQFTVQLLFLFHTRITVLGYRCHSSGAIFSAKLVLVQDISLCAEHEEQENTSKNTAIHSHLRDNLVSFITMGTGLWCCLQIRSCRSAYNRRNLSQSVELLHFGRANAAKRTCSCALHRGVWHIRLVCRRQFIWRIFPAQKSYSPVALANCRSATLPGRCTTFMTLSFSGV